MRAAIVTKYYGPTNLRGSRVIARANGNSVTVPYNHALNLDQNHKAAAESLIRKLNWTGPYFGGAINGDYVWVSPDIYPDSVAFGGECYLPKEEALSDWVNDQLKDNG